MMTTVEQDYTYKLIIGGGASWIIAKPTIIKFKWETFKSNDSNTKILDR